MAGLAARLAAELAVGYTGSTTGVADRAGASRAVLILLIV
jgi:hypothetical protein